MLGRVFGLLVVLPLMLFCARNPRGYRIRALAAMACLFFAYETYCILYRPPDSVFGVSEQCARFFALSVFCPLFVGGAHQFLNGGDVVRAQALLIISAVCFCLYECSMILITA